MPRVSDVKISCEALAYSNALTLQAVVELLAEKGFIGWDEVYDRVKKLKQEAANKGSA